MEPRKIIGLTIIGAAVAFVALGGAATAGGASALGTGLLGVGWIVLNPITLLIIWSVAFRRPRGQQQQQQVVIHVASGPSPSVQVRCPHCHGLNTPASRFCAQCGNTMVPTSVRSGAPSPVPRTTPPAGLWSAPAKSPAKPPTK